MSKVNTVGSQSASPDFSPMRVARISRRDLNRDNERLLAEARQHSKALRTQESLSQSLAAQVESLRNVEAKSAGVAEHLMEQINTLRGENTALHKAAAVAAQHEHEAMERMTLLRRDHKQLRQIDNAEPDIEEGMDTPAAARKHDRPQQEKSSKR